MRTGGRHADALQVLEVDLATLRRLGAPEDATLVTRTAIADCYNALGRSGEVLAMRREIYERGVKLDGIDAHNTIVHATRLADALINEGCYREARSFLAQQTRVARRVFGSDHHNTLTLRRHYAVSLYNDDVSRLNEALAILEDSHQTARRVFGDDHPFTRSIQHKLSEARECRAADDAADAPR